MFFSILMIGCADEDDFSMTKAQYNSLLSELEALNENYETLRQEHLSLMPRLSFLKSNCIIWMAGVLYPCMKP